MQNDSTKKYSYLQNVKKNKTDYVHIVKICL